MKENIEIIEMDVEDLQTDNIEIIEIDDYEIEIIEIDEELELKGEKTTNIPIKQSLIEKIRKKLTNKKIAKIALSSITLIITLTGVFIINKNLENNTWKENANVVYNEKLENINFTLNEEEYNKIEINTEYVEKGATLTVDGIDKTEEIIIDKTNLNKNKLGTYHIIYTYPININQVKTLYRTINVVDTTKPTIKLLGSNVYTMLKGEEYKEEGYIVTDNSNEELTDKVTTETNIDTTRPGTYYVKYTVQDSSGNETSITRTVIVKTSYYTNTNTILTNTFTETGVYFTGTVQNNNFQNQIILKNKTTGDEITIDTIKTSNHYYKVNIDTNIQNGVYELYLKNNELEPLTNNMNNYNKIARAHIGDKLVTMDYSKGNVNIKIENFEYLYDIVIDPGHGGSDAGATNGKYIEKKLNLELSQYEKQRYEQMGLKVLLLREDNDTYGIKLGDENLEDVERKGYAVGYYGSVSKIVYSNHHNSSGNTSSAGWEILVPAHATYEDLKVEHQIAQEWQEAYTKIVNPYYRFYTKDFETGTVNNKYNGEIYNFEDYYAVIRIPNKIYNVKNVIFEGAYVNNTSDMRYYYDSGNWKKLSEIKIKAMVESIGVEYIEP